MVTDIETIQLLDERGVDYISEDDIISFVQQRDSNFEDNY